METKDTELYRRYTVSLEFLNGIAGGIPATPGLAAAHVARFSAGVSNALKLSKKNMGEVTEEAMEKYMMNCSSVFPVDDKGIYLRGFQFNAMLKDAGQRMKATLKHKGLGSTIRDGGVLFPAKLYLNVEPAIVEKPVKPDNGPSNIKIFQVAEDVKLTIPCAVLDNGDLDDKLWRQLWIVAQGIGVGACRHLDYGRFRVTSITDEASWDITKLWDSDGGLTESSPVPESAGSPLPGGRKRK